MKGWLGFFFFSFFLFKKKQAKPATVGPLDWCSFDHFTPAFLFASLSKKKKSVHKELHIFLNQKENSPMYPDLFPHLFLTQNHPHQHTQK